MPAVPLSLQALGHTVGQCTLDVHRRGCDVRWGLMPCYEIESKNCIAYIHIFT